MDLIKQAFSISNADKEAAKKLYEESLRELVGKDFVRECKDAHVELSAIFGVRWLVMHKQNGQMFFTAKQYAEANVAFNYAHCVLGSGGKFLKTVKRVCVPEDCVSQLKLERMAKDMNSILTCTTANEILNAF